MGPRRSIAILLVTAAFAVSAPALADVKAGVDAWSRGDWKTAVADWQGPAQTNDPDALFNLAQAYRLGRGVPQDDAKALDYYGRAAKLGHVRAAETYGIMLFQNGQRQEALPYLQDAVRRGNPSAEYLIGLALFNGDLLPKDWVRAYALLTLANAQQLAPAKAALAQMDQYIPIDQRQEAAKLAVQLQQDADATRARELAAADLASRGVPESLATEMPAPSGGARRAPQPTANVAADPSVEAARDAVRQAMLATGTESPAEAGADYARPATSSPPRTQTSTAPRPTPSAPPRATPPPERPAPAPSAPSSTGAASPWKIQLGVFSVAGNADRLWSEVHDLPGVAGKNRLLVPAGRLTKLLVGGYASEGEAAAICQRLKQAGHDCLITR